MTAPKLRFKEFSGNWETSPLKALCKINQGLQIAIENRFLEDGENRFFYITNEFLKEGSKKNYFIENPPKSVICDESDILMTRTGNTGQVVTDVKGAFHNNFFKIDFDRSIINRNFFIEFLKKDTTQHLILKYAGASTIPDLNHSDFYRIVMPITTIEEQTKIATFLSAVDEKISQLSQKLHLLGQYKQGMMQKLFSQQIRFKADDGNEFEDWENKILGDIAFTTTGSSNREDSTELSGEYTFFDRSEDIRTSTKYLFDCEALIIPGEGSSFKPKYFMGKFDLHQRAYAVMQFKNVLAKFLYFSMQYNHQYFQSVAVGSTVKSLRLPMFQNMPIKLPALAEQTKIANFLSSIDQKIDVISEQLEQAKLWKKGLLQQMFV